MKNLKHISLLAVLVLSGCSASISYNDGEVSLGRDVVGHFVAVTVGEFETEFCALACHDGVLEIEASFTALEDIDSARVELQFIHSGEPQYLMIPSVCYNGNQWGRGKEPKGFATDGVTHTYSYRRTPVPGATYSESCDFAVALWGETPSSAEEGFSCGILPCDEEAVHSLIWPVEERPFVYCARDSYSSSQVGRMSFAKGQTFKAKIYLLVTDVKPSHGSVSDFVDAAWEWADKSQIAPDPDDDQIWHLGIRYAKESLWAEDGPYRGLSIGLVADENGGWKQRPFWKYEVGWCGQNASYANSLLTDYLRYGDRSSLEMALEIFETWTCEAATLPSGLYITNWDYILRGDENPSLDACNLGTAAGMFFEGAALFEKCSAGSPEKLRKVALGILDFAKGDQQEDGCYARGWYADGSCIVRDGTVGAFLVAPMVTASALTSDGSYLESAVKAFDYYYGQFADAGYTTAGALDTWCIDKESSFPLIQSALLLYDATGDRHYVEAAEQLANYLMTWTWQYKGVYPAQSDFAQYDFDTFGMTSVSVQHHHLDPYAIKCVPSLMRLAELSGRKVWEERARAIWNAGCQMVSDGSLEIAGRVRPTGSQNEAFYHCDWGFDGLSSEKRMNDWLVAWPGAFRLEVLRAGMTK